MAQAVVCLVSNISEAEYIVNALREAGFSNSDISLLMSERDTGIEKHSKAPEGAATGAGTGALLGGALGWLVGIGALAIPGAGPFLAAGPLFAALAGATAGTAIGGITGGLVGLGMPEYEVKAYEQKVHAGDILISVHTENMDEARDAERIFKNAQAHDVHRIGEERATGGPRR